MPLIIFTLLFTLSYSIANAETFSFKNGDRLSGRVVLETETNYIIQTQLGQIAVPKDKLADISSSVQKKQTQLPATTNEPSSSSDTLDAINEQENIASKNEIKKKETSATDTAKKEEEKKDLKISGDLSISAFAQTGNTDEFGIDFDSDTTFRRKNDRFILSFEYDRAEANNVVTDDELVAEGIYDHFFSKKWFSNANIRFEQDDVSQLDLRSEYGLGMGYQPYETDDLNIKMVAGVNYIKDEFNSGDTQEDIGATWAFDYNQKIFSRGLKLFHDHDLVVPFDDTAGFLFESETGLKIPVVDNLTTDFKIEFDWDNDPAMGVREADTQYTFGLGYSY